MSRCISVRWTLVGVLAVLGGYWLMAYAMFASGLDEEWSVYAGHLAGAALGGGSIAAHAAVPAKREPLVAGVLATAVLGLLSLVLPHPDIAWLPSEHAWVVAVLAVLSGASAFVGAKVVSRIATTPSSAMSNLALSGLLVMGTTICSMQGAIGLGVDEESLILVIPIMVGIYLSGWITQWMVAVRRPWACGAGSLVYVLVIAAEDPSAADLPAYIVSSMILVTLGYFGARLGWRTSREALPSLPTARVE